MARNIVASVIDGKDIWLVSRVVRMHYVHS